MRNIGQRQHLTYTAIPRGFADNEDKDLLVGVRITPRLAHSATEATLEDFPDFRRWPVGGFWWSATFDGGQTWERAADERWASDGGFWEAAFHPDLPVRSQTVSEPPVRTVTGYRYRQLRDRLPDFFRAPTLGDSDLGTQINLLLKDPDAQLPVGEPLAQFAKFHQALKKSPLDPSPPPRGQLDPDFHQRISMIGDHGPLLERLGLVLELQFPARAGFDKIAVRLNWETPGPADPDAEHRVPFVHPTRHASPFTRVNYQPGVIFAAARGAVSAERLDQRFQVISAKGFSAHDIDVDAALVAGFGVESLDSAPPTASSGGFCLVLDDTSGEATRRIDRIRAPMRQVAQLSNYQQDRLATNIPDLDSDHLLQGYDIEVQHQEEAGQPWRGLCHRTVDYIAHGKSGQEISFTARDVAPVVTSFRRVEGSATDLETSDVLTRWDGWSIAVHRPGTYELQSDASTGEIVTEPGWLGFPIGTVEMNASIPEGAAYKLPPLRFGHRYRFRLRAVDVTGFAHQWDGTQQSQSPPIPYRRYDPVPAPLVLAPPTLTRTEGTFRMVVRTHPLGLRPVSTFRTIVPRRTSVEDALAHGVFDKGGVPDPDAWDRIVELDDRVPPAEAASLASQPSTPAAMTVDWLADPTSVHVLVSRPTGRTGQGPVVLASHLPPGSDALGNETVGRWQSVALRLDPVDTLERTAILDPIEQPGQRVVPVQLGPGKTMTVELRGLPPEERVDELGLAAEDPFLAAHMKSVANGGGILSGKINPVCPPVTVDLVHAVQRPLSGPEPASADGPYDPLTVTRGSNDKDARIVADIEYHPETTGRLMVHAKWSDWQDLGPGAPRLAAPSRQEITDVVVADRSTSSTPPDGRRTESVNGRVVLPDLRRRDVNFIATAVGRYLEEFRERLNLGFTNVKKVGWVLDLPEDVDVESIRLLRTVVVDGIEVDRDLESATDYEVVLDPRSDRRSLRLIDASIRAEVIVLGVRQSVTWKADLGTRVVPAAMRPLPPEVDYVVPAFETSSVLLSDQLGGTSLATRGTPRIRIWLERPWWSSGEDEKLAVVWDLDVEVPDPQPPGLNDDTGSKEDRLSKLVTRISHDPAFSIGYVAGGAHPKPITGVDVDPVVLDEGLPTAVTAQVRVHEVKYDKNRDMYFVEVGWTDQAYGSFVQLAVARYQQHVTEGHSRLSPIRTIDPVQLLPSRTASAANQDNKIRVRVSGPADGLWPERYFTVSVQRRVHAGDEHLGWDTVTKVVTPRGDVFPPLGFEFGDDFQALYVNRPKGNGTFRILVEEYEYFPSWDLAGEAPDLRQPNGHVLKSVDDAYVDLTSIRPSWVTTLPMPKNG